MKPLTYHSSRRLFAWLQAVLILGLPFVRISGESALRFDVPSLRLYFFGSVLWISESFFFLLIFLLIFLGIMLFTVLYGRLWCGWACPQTVLSDFARSIERIAAWFKMHRVLRSLFSHLILVLLSGLVSASLLWYFVSPYDVFADMVNDSIGPWTFWSWVLFATLIYINLAFVRQKFCVSVCPYARLQSAFFDDRTLTIAFDRTRQKECLGCEDCTSACPTNIDIKQGLQVECINCAECIDSCIRQMARRGKKSLINYSKGTTDQAVQKGARPRVIGLSAAFAIIAVLFAHQIFVRMPVDFWVIRDEAQSYHQVGIQGHMLNAYSLAVENRSLQPASYRLSISGIKDAELVLAQNPFIIPGNSLMKIRVYVFARRRDHVERITQLRFLLENTASQEIRVVQEAPFIYPDRSDKGVEI